MSDKTFVFSSELSKRLIELRFENEWLFKKRKQPWKDFHKILLENGFPEKMTVKHASKKWNYIYESYRIAKKTKNKNWKYYKLFNDYYGKNQILDKYEAWNDEWRRKFINCMIEAKDLRHDFKNMWLVVERGLRSQDLPEECCIQDIKGLWHHLRTTFSRKYRLKLRNGNWKWGLFDAMLSYYEATDPDGLAKLAAPPSERPRPRKCSHNYLNKNTLDYDEYDFEWTKDITETFIQLRLQYDWLFRERKWAWNDLLEIMIKEHGFPKLLTGREICRKWASTFSEYQKATATNNKSWMYYKLFELYLGEGSLSFDMLKGWQEEWVLNLISARIDLEHLFKLTYKDQTAAWREVEKRLRSIGLPLDHSVLELPEIWRHLEKTYRWKKKFSEKGILTEQWPYFDAMSQYESIKTRHPARQIAAKHKPEPEFDTADHDDDCDDEMKLFDLKQKLEREVKPKFEYLEANQCRSCSGEEGCVNIYQQRDDDGLNLADKLRVIGDIEVEPSDNLPSQICLDCLKDLENAFRFRRKCQKVDKQLRNPNTAPRVKVELLEVLPVEHDSDLKNEPHIADDFVDHFDDLTDAETKHKSIKSTKIKRDRERKIPKKKRKVKKAKYEYYKICDQCGKYTKNLKNHLDAHATGKFYSCEICDKKFKFKSGLVIHKAVHETTPKKTCEICGKTFHILAQYRRHFVYHANERKYECETCGKRFNTLDILRVHNRVHTDERPFSCPICGKTFRTAGCVSRHKRIVHRTTKSQNQ